MEAKLHRRITAEDGHEHGELLSGGLHVGNNGGHGGERPIGDGDLIANGVGDFDLAVAVTIRMPLSLIPSSSASSCRRPVDFSALLFGKKN